MSKDNKKHGNQLLKNPFSGPLPDSARHLLVRKEDEDAKSKSSRRREKRKATYSDDKGSKRRSISPAQLSEITEQQRHSYINQLLSAAERPKGMSKTVKLLMGLGFSQILSEPMAVEYKKLCNRPGTPCVVNVLRNGLDDSAQNIDQERKENIEVPSNAKQPAVTCVIVVIAAVGYPKHKLSEAQMEKIENELVNEICQHESPHKLRFNGIAFKAGYMTIKCLDSKSAHWLREQIRRRVDEMPLKACNEEELPKYSVISLVLPKSSLLSLTFITKLIDKQNPDLHIEDWDIFHEHNEFMDKHILVRIDEHSMNAILKNDLKLYYRLDAISVKVLGNENGSDWEKTALKQEPFLLDDSNIFQMPTYIN